jgi:hypothetical protein
MARAQPPGNAPKNAALVLYATRESDGYTYSLSFESAEWLKSSYPKVQPFPRLFLAQDVKEDFASTHQQLAPKLVSLLLRLSEEEVSSLGEVVFSDPETERVLFAWKGGK